jgi:hypothetical protein
MNFALQIVRWPVPKRGDDSVPMLGRLDWSAEPAGRSTCGIAPLIGFGIGIGIGIGSHHNSPAGTFLELIEGHSGSSRCQARTGCHRCDRGGSGNTRDRGDSSCPPS